MNAKLKDEIIKDFENRINEKINLDYNYFCIWPYRKYTPEKHGVIFNGEQLAVCDNLQELENIINTILFFLNGGLKK